MRKIAKNQLIVLEIWTGNNWEKKLSCKSLTTMLGENIGSLCPAILRNAWFISDSGPDSMGSRRYYTFLSLLGAHDLGPFPSLHLASGTSRRALRKWQRIRIANRLLYMVFKGTKSRTHLKSIIHWIFIDTITLFNTNHNKIRVSTIHLDLTFRHVWQWHLDVDYLVPFLWADGSRWLIRDVKFGIRISIFIKSKWL